jgi:outer membrane biogenesis lipoprotein LolB
MRAALLACAFLAGCAAPAPHTVGVDVQVVEKIVPVPCRIALPAKPTPHVALVQLTGKPLEDLVRIWRAAEAELEERRAYEIKLEAAAQACDEGKPP